MVIRAIERSGPTVLFLLVAIGSLFVLRADHLRLRQTFEASVTAIDNLTHARLHVARALLAEERLRSEDRLLPASRPAAEVEEALALLDDFLQGRSSLLGMEGPRPADPALRELVAGYASALRILSTDLSSGAYMAGDPVERQLRMAELLESEHSIEAAMFDALREQVARGEVRHRIHLGAWILFMLMAGGAFVAIGRASERHEEARRTAEAGYAALASHAGAGVVRTDREGRLIESTPHWLELFGAASGGLLGQQWWDVVAGEWRGRAAESWMTEAGRSDNFLVEVRHRSHDAASLYLASRWVRNPGGNGGDESWIGTFIDQTEHRIVQDQLLQAQKMEAVGRLAGGIAHDFNNLLTVIVGHTQFALDSRAGPDFPEQDLQEIQSAAQRASNLTRHLLAFSRHQLIEPRVIDVADVIRSAETLIRRLIGADIELEINMRGNVGHVRFDPTQAEQVLMNLAINARDAMPGGGRLTIEAEDMDVRNNLPTGFIGPFTPGRYVRLRVSDTGTGMPPEIRERVFEPFFTTKGAHQGTGLGLSTVYGIIKQSDGFIRVESEPGSGTSFEIYLPWTDAPVEDRAIQHDPSPDAKGSETILIVEDQQPVRSVARKILENAGYQVIEAANGQEALSILQRRAMEIGLVLTDMVMPAMGGGELARRLWKRHPALRIVFMSGYAEDEFITPGGLDPRIHFLEKPFDARTLQEKVRSAFASGPAA